MRLRHLLFLRNHFCAISIRISRLAPKDKVARHLQALARQPSSLFCVLTRYDQLPARSVPAPVKPGLIARLSVVLPRSVSQRIARHRQGTVGIDPDRPCARALQLLIGEIAEILTRLDHAMSSFGPRLKMDLTLWVHVEVPACAHMILPQPFGHRRMPRPVLVRPAWCVFRADDQTPNPPKSTPLAAAAAERRTNGGALAGTHFGAVTLENSVAVLGPRELRPATAMASIPIARIKPKTVSALTHRSNFRGFLSYSRFVACPTMSRLPAHGDQFHR